MKIMSWNINGIRASWSSELLPLLQEGRYDVIALQETKATSEQLLNLTSPITKTYNFLSTSAEKKGYSGVCFFIKKEISYTEKKITSLPLGADTFQREGRTLISEFKNFYLLNAYFPNGGREHLRLPYKMRYNHALQETVKSLQKKKEVLIVGDFNVAHREIDLKNPQGNRKTSGFLPAERDWFTELLKQGYQDVFRTFYPQKKEDYTWWTYRHQCRERNIGWRIDYAVASNALVPHIKNIAHLSQQRGSDHCPVVCELLPCTYE